MQPEARKERAYRRKSLAKSTRGWSVYEFGQSSYQSIHTRETILLECGLCCESVPMDMFRLLHNCGHTYCKVCIKKHITFAIHESRIEVPCPGCTAFIHPDDVKKYCVQDAKLIAKYDEFSLRTALLQFPDARWCPAPDCGYAVIVPNGAKCPQIKCERPGCNTDFCFVCRKEWHPRKSCAHAAFIEKHKKKVTETEHVLRPCPRCSTMIMKENDGSCNHMHCTMCKAEFCWLCLKEITDLHYMSPTGCTFWGKKQWSKKRKLMWQIGTLIGSPVLIAAGAVISLPLLAGGIPFSVGKKVYKHMKNHSKAKRIAATAAAVTGSAILSPAMATIAVGVGVPLALGYTYVVVPRAVLYDFIDYIRKRKRIAAGSEYVEAIEMLDPRESSDEQQPLQPVEDLNSDGSAPGPSTLAGSSEDSSDFSSIIDESGSVSGSGDVEKVATTSV